MGDSEIVSDRTRLADGRLWGGECLPALSEASPPKGSVIWTSFDRALVFDEVCDMTEVGFLEVGLLTGLLALELGLNTSSSMLGSGFSESLLRDGFIASAPNKSVLDIGFKVSSKSRVKALPLASGFIGLSSTNDELAPSTLPLSSSLSLSLLSLTAPVPGGRIFGKGRLPEDSTRLRFSFFGDGDTGSPRSRLRAREIAEGGWIDESLEPEGSADSIGGNGSGDWSRCED